LSVVRLMEYEIKKYCGRLSMGSVQLDDAQSLLKMEFDGLLEWLKCNRKIIDYTFICDACTNTPEVVSRKGIGFNIAIKENVGPEIESAYFECWYDKLTGLKIQRK